MYLKTNLFNNVFAAYAGINKTENINLNDSHNSINEIEKIKEIITLDFFSFSIGKKAFYGKTTNMFGIELGVF